MEAFVIASLAALFFASAGFAQDDSGGNERARLLLVQEIPLAHVEGCIDHFTFDAKRKRVIGAALGIISMMFPSDIWVRSSTTTISRS